MKIDGMKKAFLLLSLFLYCSSSYSQSYCCYYNGYWGDWRLYYWDFHEDIKIYGGYNGFIIYKSSEHPSNYFFKPTITGYTKPTKKEIKEHFKTNTWWTFYGVVEYYVCDVYPTFSECIKQLHRPLLESDTQTQSYKNNLSITKATMISKTGRFNGIGYKKVFKSAEIKIAPYKKHPKCYNILIEDVGYAIDLEDKYFEEKK